MIASRPHNFIPAAGRRNSVSPPECSSTFPRLDARAQLEVKEAMAEGMKNAPQALRRAEASTGSRAGGAKIIFWPDERGHAETDSAPDLDVLIRILCGESSSLAAFEHD